MALLDYKIVRYSHNGRHVSADVRVYRGRMEDETHTNLDGSTFTTNRYVRIAKVRTFHLEYDVPRDMTRDMTRKEFVAKVRAYLNNKLLTYAQVNGHTVISQQQDTSEYEDVVNESET